MSVQINTKNLLDLNKKVLQRYNALREVLAETRNTIHVRMSNGGLSYPEQTESLTQLCDDLEIIKEEFEKCVIAPVVYDQVKQSHEV